MKRKTAKDILAESFREIAQKKSIDKITVKDITENCGYSSATFYRHFKDKYDLIAWNHAQSVAEIMNRIGINHYPWKQTLLDGARSFQDQKEYLSNLFLHTSGHESFVKYMTEINYTALRNYILKASGEKSWMKKQKCISEFTALVPSALPANGFSVNIIRRPKSWQRYLKTHCQYRFNPISFKNERISLIYLIMRDYYMILN